MRPTLRSALRPPIGLIAALVAAHPAPAQAPPDMSTVVAPTPRPDAGEASTAEAAAPRSDASGDGAADQDAAPPDQAGAPTAAAVDAAGAAAAGSDGSSTAETPADANADPAPAPTTPRHDERPVAYDVVNARAIPSPLGGVVGEAAAGPAAAMAAGCADCHVMPDDGDAENGLVIAAARLQAGGLRLAIVNLGIRDPRHADHAFYDLPPYDPDAETPPTTLLTAAEVEAIVAWLTGAAR